MTFYLDNLDRVYPIVAIKVENIRENTVNPLLSPPGGLSISSPFERGDLIDTGAYSYLRWGAYLIQKQIWYQFSIKNYRIQSGKAQVQEVGDHVACEKIIASLWPENSSRDLRTEFCTRVLELCSRSDSWS